MSGNNNHEVTLPVFDPSASYGDNFNLVLMVKQYAPELMKKKNRDIKTLEQKLATLKQEVDQLNKLETIAREL